MMYEDGSAQPEVQAEIKSLLVEFNNYVYIYHDGEIRIDGAVRPENFAKLGEIFTRLSKETK